MTTDLYCARCGHEEPAHDPVTWPNNTIPVYGKCNATVYRYYQGALSITYPCNCTDFAHPREIKWVRPTAKW